MRSMSLVLGCAALSAVAVSAAAQADATPDPAAGAAPWAGTWTNMPNTLHIRATKCGDAMCGTVVWADDKGKAEAAAKGRTLVGAEVFRNFRKVGPNVWKGQVYIPALDRTVSGKIELTDSESIAASACLLGFIGCQTRHYKRIR